MHIGSKVHPKRFRNLNKKDFNERGDKVVYWMSRDQRVQDNWALLLAQDIAIQNKRDLKVIFCLTPNFLGATKRHYHFMLEGLKEVEQSLQDKNISFELLVGEVGLEISVFSRDAFCLVTDFSPLKISKKWKTEISKKINCPLIEVDAHNIIPCWETSNKQEYAARTIRPKIHKKLDEFLTDFPKLKIHNTKIKNDINWAEIYKNLKIDESVAKINWIKPGEKEAHKTLQNFIDKKISNYSEAKNDPNENSLSNMSPYLHFGQISAQRIALKTKNFDTYFEELVVRRELSDNFCYYNKNYDNIKGAPEWAIKTLHKHKNDKREYVYTKEQFEHAKTHDDAWNAAQIQMVETGKMHGYMRMYWAKKILEWTKSPKEAIEIAIYLNDKYELDGRDPNGYTGIMWSICGVHDRPWFERKVYGTIRYMNFNGLKRKFDVQKYINTWKM